MDTLLHTTISRTTTSRRRLSGRDLAFLVVAITTKMTGMIGAITKAAENIMMAHILFRILSAETRLRQ
jgi:hypothetical protein